MTLEYRCSNCGTLLRCSNCGTQLQITNADPLHGEIGRLAASNVERTMNQHLILHKVRGEPQFDIAEKTMIGDEDGWVLCTCGHRAYPFWYMKLDELEWWEYSGMEKAFKSMPPDWPEHYPEPKEQKPDFSKFFASLTKFVRRI